MNNDAIIDWSTTALLVVDMQRAFVEAGQPLCVAGAQSTVPALVRAVASARSRGGTIVWVRREYAPDGSDMEPFRRRQMQAAGTLDVMAKGSYGVQPMTGLEGRPEDLVVVKKRFSGFFGTGLNERLQQKGIGTVIVAGTQTPNCVRATAFDALSYDYRAIVLADCTSSANEQVQRANLEDMANAGIEVWPSLRA